MECFAFNQRKRERICFPYHELMRLSFPATELLNKIKKYFILATARSNAYDIAMYK